MVHVVDAPVERLGARMPERPVWACSVRSDLTWAQAGRRVVVATGVAPDAIRRPAG
ncbi:hypothetical protein AB0E27_15010 [Streptomyces sparsogenes]|uniref:hypothetical protein n=1 Tax=Streptomyces sparsogenes TaxID=67365 RepID=UPI0033CFDE60